MKDTWNTRETLPKTGQRIEYQSVPGNKPDHGTVISTGIASYKPFITTPLLDPLTHVYFGGHGDQPRWVKESTGKVVPGRIVRWRKI